MLRIIVGAGGDRLPGWIGLDQDDLNIINPLAWANLFAPNSIDAIVGEHVFEHLTFDEGFAAARLAYVYLKPGGVLRIAVPDGFHTDPTYINWVAPGTGYNGDDHKVLYDYKSLSSVLRTAGFSLILREWFDEQGTLHTEPLDATYGRIRRSANSLWAMILSLGLGTVYTSLVIDGVK